jgi:hypothetical protein
LKTKDPEWRIIRNNLGFEFYYHVNTKESTWRTPESLQPAKEVDVDEEEVESSTLEAKRHMDIDSVKRKLGEANILSHELEARRAAEDSNKKPKTNDEEANDEEEIVETKPQQEPEGLSFEERVDVFKVIYHLFFMKWGTC